MHVLLTGASGFVGRALRRRLEAAGHTVMPLPRTRPAAGGPWWNPAAGTIDLAGMRPPEGVVHLAGESIVAGRWTVAVKTRIRESRVAGTALLARALADLTPRPAVLVAASAIGIYGDRGPAALAETDAPGDGFLATVCRDWETAARPAAEAGLRVVHPRLGIVLDRSGGALARMLTPFRLGLGGRLGGGGQYMSWATLDDATTILARLLTESDWNGPVNVVAPEAVTNATFTQTLARVLHRPARLPAPAWALRLVFGEMADAALLASQRVRPARLQAAGHTFQHPALEPALRALLA